MSSQPVSARRWPGLALGGVSILIYAFLYLPIVVVILYSFSSTKLNAWPIESYTLDWYRELREDTEIQNAIWLSFRVGLVSALVALVLGTAGALGLRYFLRPGKAAIRFLIMLPITLPGIVTGISLLAYFSLMDKPLSYWTTSVGEWTFPWPMIIGHVTFCITLVLGTVSARLSRLPYSLGEASADLGATPFTTFRKVTMPLILPSMISGAILAFTLSFDEIVVSLFLKGRENTLPLLIWGRLRLGISPEINAAATVIIVVSLIGVVTSSLLLRRTGSE